MSDSRRRKPEEIENEIYQARARLDETLHEIEERFSPQQLMNATYDYLRHGGAHEIADSLGRTVRENPLPVVLTGVGLGWLMLSQRGQRHAYHQDDHHQGETEHRPGGYRRQAGYPGATVPTHSRMPNGGDMADDTHSQSKTPTGAGTTTLGHDPAALGATQQHASGAGSQSPEHQSHEHGGLSDKAHQMTDKAQQMMGKVKHQAQHVGSQLRSGASHVNERQHAAMDAVSHRARDTGHGITQFVQDHPLIAGALGVAVGAALGSLFAPTRVENRHLGEVRDRAMHRASEYGHEQMDHAKEKIHETADRVRSEVRSHASANEESHGSSRGYVENPSSEERYAKAGSGGKGEGGLKSEGAAKSAGTAASRGDGAHKGGSGRT
ncbi:DUF3618 domain-containing protein [Halomonas sp. E14]|uniref:DUF3618 domain-containing protein n=1 Tax=Halomonas sp. E14 TaxID=3397245 RepID=UPI00403E5072